MLASWLSLRLAPVRAAELPEGTDKVESLTPDQARKLVKEFPGVELEIENKRSAQWRLSNCLPLKGLKSLDPDTAKALAGYDKGPLVLSGLTTIDTDTAKGLAEFKGPYVYLSGLTTIDADAAKAIAEVKSHNLCLNGLATLDAVTAKALAKSKAWNGRLPKLTTLDTEAARALAAIDTWNGQLPGLTAFESSDSIAIAKALATRKGSLSLPNLKRISPKTLSALITKEDVEIPLIEKLELIPESDGGGTEDFVIPKEFEERQKQKAR